MERIVAVRPEAGFLSVDVDTGVAHGAVEDEGCFLAGRKCRGFKVQAIPAYTDKGKSARASCVFQCFLLPVLGDSDFLFVIFDTERTVDSPVVRDGDGLDVTKSKGIMIVNIGAETTEISVLSLGGIVISKSVKIGGNKLDDSIISAVRKVYNLIIGSKTAEGLKKELGSAVQAEETFAPGFGRNVLSGLPVSVDISSDVIYSAVVDPLHSIMDSIKVILERTPPELAADIIKNGIYVSGGTSNIRNLEKFIHQETNLAVNIVENPAESVVRGLMGVVSNPDFAGVAYTPQDKNYD